MNKHIGTWALVRVEATDTNGKPAAPPFGGEGVIGRVVLTADGRLSASIIDGRSIIPDGDHREYSCYTGLYTFDGKTLITTVDACSDPERMGTQQIRNVTFEDELMILQPPLRSYGDKPAERRTLWWKKISNIQFLVACASRKLEHIDNTGFFSFEKYIHLDVKQPVHGELVIHTCAK